MTGEKYQMGRIFMERLSYDGDLLKVLTPFCREQGVRAGYPGHSERHRQRLRWTGALAAG